MRSAPGIVQEHLEPLAFILIHIGGLLVQRSWVEWNQYPPPQLKNLNHSVCIYEHVPTSFTRVFCLDTLNMNYFSIITYVLCTYDVWAFFQALEIKQGMRKFRSLSLTELTFIGCLGVDMIGHLSEELLDCMLSGIYLRHVNCVVYYYGYKHGPWS